MSPCIRILFVSFFRNFLAALIIASAPSRTLNPTCRSCISAMMWSACWSTATDSISFRGVSFQECCGRNFVLFDPSGLSTSRVNGTMLARSHNRVSSLFAKPIIHTCAQFTNVVSPSSTFCSAFRWERPRPAWFSTILCHLQPCQHSSPGEWFDLQASLLHSSISSFIFCHSSSGKLSLGSFCMDQLCRFFAWSCLFASHHDLFRCSQTSIVCFEYCSVHFPKVRLLFVLAFFLSSSSCCFVSAL